jgi:hypothetical protein
MVEKLTIYGDDERTEVLECRERFARRKDKLRERRTYPMADVTQEFFDPGSSYGLKDITLTKGAHREVNFFHMSRLDGLSKRVEEIRKKTMEFFLGRDDRLEYRSVTYLPMPERNPLSPLFPLPLPISSRSMLSVFLLALSPNEDFDELIDASDALNEVDRFVISEWRCCFECPADGLDILTYRGRRSGGEHQASGSAEEEVRRAAATHPQDDCQVRAERGGE